MARKSQHATHYRHVPVLLREMREAAGLTQRALGEKLKKPQSWIYNCEVFNRRVDAAEFCLWAHACGVKPAEAIHKLWMKI
jgi:transcriptional regulator with XRE-family HTH domain